MKAWASSVQDKGVAGEGAARLVRNEIVFSQRWCWFEVEASQSGPHTLNWLILVHLNFGIDVWPVDYVAFNPAPAYDARIQYPLAQTQVVRSLRDLSTASGDSTQEYVPSKGIEHTYSWTYGALVGIETPFPVRFSDDWNWCDEETEIFVVFQTSLSKAEVRRLSRVALGWLQLAYWGGFGGEGLRHFDRPAFSADCRNMRIRANFEGGDMERSIEVFVNTLRSFHQHSTAIESIAIGASSSSGPSPSGPSGSELDS